MATIDDGRWDGAMIESNVEKAGDFPHLDAQESHSSYSQSQSKGGANGEAPTEAELSAYRHIADSVPLSGYLVAVVEMSERFAYYGLSAPFQNYMQNPVDDPFLPGALGLGQSTATALQYFWSFWCYVTPLFGAIVADQYLGRYNTIIIFALIYMAGLLILVCTSIPASIAGGSAYAGFIASVVVIGIGSGGIKANVSPLIAEQYRSRGFYFRTLKSGEKVIVDPDMTIQRIYMMFYWCINCGSLSGIATVYLEKYVGFWAAYLLPFCMFFVGMATLVIGRKYYVTTPPQGSVILQAFKAWWIAIRARGNLEAARPSYQAALPGGPKHKTNWDDSFIDQLRRSLVACKVFLVYPIFWVCYGQMTSNFVSMAGDMNLHGIPNDIILNAGPLTIMIFIPIFDSLIYPGLRRIGIKFLPITRITAGFVVAAAAMGYSAGIQRLIYNTGPCYDNPRGCGDGRPNDIHVALQVPCYAIMGIAEICASITGLEYAYTKAPSNMKSFIMSLYLLTNAGGSALGIAISPTAVHPKLVWSYTGLCAATVTTGIIFWLCFRKLNASEEQMNREGRDDHSQAVHKVSEVNVLGSGPLGLSKRSVRDNSEKA